MILADLHFDLQEWIPTLSEITRAAATGAGVLVVGLIVYFGLRKYILRTRLTAASLVTIAACAVYFGFIVGKPKQMLSTDDRAALWIHRLFAAAILFAAMRALDRLLIVPILSRGGRVPVSRFVHQIINIVISCFAILSFGAWAFGWNIQGFLAGSAVVSIVLGLALQETLGNFFSGLVMQAASPFAIGDWIVCAGVEGRVVDMTWRAVSIHTLEDNYVIIPNGTVAGAQIVNFNTPTTATACSVTVGLHYDHPPVQAIALLKKTALETEGVASKPEPYIFLQSFDDSAITYSVKFWITDPPSHAKIETLVRTNIWYRVKEKGFSIPFPMRTVEHVQLDKKLEAQAETTARDRYNSIKGLWLFAPLSEDEKLKLARGASDLTLAPGQVLFRQNDPGDTLYVIRSGDAEVLVDQPDGSQTKVASLPAGNFFGEMSALTGQPRTATIRAAGELTCVVIDKDDLSSIFSADPGMMEKISQLIAERNAHRQAKVQAAAADAAAKQDEVKTEQKSLLGRMLRFFGRAPQGDSH
jgi:small-conductance mechanosensitive channel/CRP-like cAMP-binding protein